MSSKGGRIKRARNVRHLDSDGAQSIINERLNIIPAGRQLERTPPSKSERFILDETNKPEDPPTTEHVIKDEPCAQEITTHASFNGSSEVLQHLKVENERKSIRRSNSTAVSATPGDADPETFIQGMQGYQWTEADLEFVYQTKWKKQVQQLKQEFSDVQKSLKGTRQLRDVALATHDKIQTELSKMSSCERVQQISREILLKSHESSEVEGLDSKGLLARVKVADVQIAITEEKAKVSKLKTEVSKAQINREKVEQLSKDIDSCKMNIDQMKLNVHTLTVEIAALESQLSGKKETSQSAQPRQRGRKAPKLPTAPKPPKISPAPSAPTAPKPPKTSPAPSAPKAPTAPKPPKTSPAPSAPKAPTAPKPPKTSPAPSAPKPPTASKPPKTLPPPSAPKPPRSAHATSGPKPPRSAPGTSGPKASTAPSVSKPPRSAPATSGPKPPRAPAAPHPAEVDDGGLRRSKRIAAKKK